MLEYLFIGGLVVDGTGNEAYWSNVGIRGGKIVYIGNEEPFAEERVNIEGKCIAPGFIDFHSHGDFTIPVYRQAESAIGQGITTIVGGNCGMSPSPCPAFYSQFPFEERAVSRVMPPPFGGINPGFVQVVPTSLIRPAYEAEFGERLDWSSFGEYAEHMRRGTGVNMICLVGHGQIRLQVLGPDSQRASDPFEIDEIVDMCRQAMDEGAAGISFGLDYEPGCYADKKELIAVAESVAEKNKIITAHYQMRQFRRGKKCIGHTPVDGIREMLDLALETGVHMHLSHLNQIFSSEGDEQKIDAMRLIDEIHEYRTRGAEISYDTLASYTGGDFYYPNLAHRFQPYLIQAGGISAFSRALKIGNYRDQLASDIRKGRDPSTSPLTRIDIANDPDWGKSFLITKTMDESAVGKTVGELCKEKGRDVIDVMLDLLSEDPYTCYSTWVDGEISPESEVYLNTVDMALGLDVSPVNYNSAAPYPKGDYTVNRKSTATYCGYIKYLTSDVSSLEEKVKHLTKNPAEILGIKDRGTISPGKAADLVVFDKTKLNPCEDFVFPEKQPEGILHVMVNGEFALKDGHLMNRLNGKFIDYL